MVQRELIFDLGMFEGQDAEFYMSKGFRVISLEANPELCKHNSEKYSREIAAGRGKMDLQRQRKRAEDSLFHTSKEASRDDPFNSNRHNYCRLR